MPQVYSLADVCVLASIPTPTWQEQFGMVLIEAMACGVLVIGTDSGGIPWVIGDAGIISTGGYKKFTEGIQDLWEHPEKRAEFEEKGKQRVRSFFDRTVVSKQIAHIYAKLFSK